LTEKQIIQGHFRALLRIFLVPIVLVASLQITAMVFQFGRMWGAAGGLNINVFMVTQIVVGLITFVTGSLALVWFGMWRGLVDQKPALAALRTYAFVALLPGIGITIVQSMAMVSMSVFLAKFMSPKYTMVVPTLIGGVLSLIKDGAFIIWSRRRLYGTFRRTAAGDKAGK
jgi:hypothetical protein